MATKPINEFELSELQISVLVSRETGDAVIHMAVADAQAIFSLEAVKELINKLQAAVDLAALHKFRQNAELN